MGLNKGLAPLYFLIGSLTAILVIGFCLISYYDSSPNVPLEPIVAFNDEKISESQATPEEAEEHDIPQETYHEEDEELEAELDDSETEADDTPRPDNYWPKPDTNFEHPILFPVPAAVEQSTSMKSYNHAYDFAMGDHFAQHSYFVPQEEGYSRIEPPYAPAMAIDNQSPHADHANLAADEQYPLVENTHFPNEASSLDYSEDNYGYTDDCSCQDSCSGCVQKQFYFYPYISHTEGRWLGTHLDYTSIGEMFAFSSSTSRLQPFLDIRGHLFNNGEKGANVGGGVRYQTDSGALLGVNAYYDYRKGEFHNYHQLGLGIERLGQCWEFRVNGYIPVCQQVGHSKIHVFDDFIGDFFATCQEKQASMWGVDAELGRWLCMDCCSCFDLYAGIGPYYYASKVNKHKAYGGELRLLSHIGKYFTLELICGYDRISRGMVQATITFGFPIIASIFCGDQNNCCDCPCPMTFQPVHRQEIIALGRKDCCMQANWDRSSSSSHRSSSSSSCSHCN